MKNWVNKIFCGDSFMILSKIPSNFVDCIITSPPYFGLRDYGVHGQLGLEKTPEEYVDKIFDVFREAKRVLKRRGTVWLNLGDSYSAGGNGGHGEKQHTNRGTRAMAKKPKKTPRLKPKNLIGIPWRIALALQADGWYLRQDIIWHKPNPMPESVTDRCTKSHEYIFLISKSPKYYFETIKEKANYDGRKQEKMRGSSKYADKEIVPGNTPHTFASRGHVRWQTIGGEKMRNKRSVWTVPNQPLQETHFATFPESLIEPMILAGCPKGGIVLDLFMGSGTVAVVAKKLDRNYIGIEINPEYIKIAKRRLAQQKLF